MDMAGKIRRILAEKGVTQIKLAERIGVSQSTVHRWLKGAEPEGHHRDEINRIYAEISGASSSDVQPLVPIVGRAGAATDGAIAYADGDGNFGWVPRPPGASPETVAVEISGGSMGYLADGSIVIYSARHPEPLPDMIGYAVVLSLPDGRVLLKRLLRGSEPGLWDLESINGPILSDRRVEWFSHIDYIIPPWRAAQLKVPV